MLRSFLAFKKAKQEEAEAIFLQPGWASPSQNRLAPNCDYVSWAEVQSFLQMAEQALAVRHTTNETLRKQLEAAQSESLRVKKTSSAAQEESSFLADSMQGLVDERSALKEALGKASRDKEHLKEENELLRQQLREGEESSAALQLLARLQDELQEVQQRNLQLENENMQLQARVSALERATTAQATAMLSCLEESERVRLQQLSISIPNSPGPLPQPCRTEFTSDGGSIAEYVGGGAASSTYTDVLELASDGSYVSCVTPWSTGTGSGGSGSMFRAVSTSPSPRTHGNGGSSGSGGPTSRLQTRSGVSEPYGD